MTDLPHRPTSEDIAKHVYESEPFDPASLDRDDILELMADAVRLDRRQRLARRIVYARNYLYEATMNDYSVASINQGERNLQSLLVEASREGWGIETLTVWDPELGRFRPVIS